MRNACLLVVVVSFSLIPSLRIQAQVSKVSSENIMDAVFDMKKASEAVDKLASDMSKYCKWGIASLDTSDLNVAISSFLLNHGSQVPETVLASNMWRVSFVAGDVIHHLAASSSQCDLGRRYSDDARMSDAASSVLMRLFWARSKFNKVAYQQTRWQEQESGNVEQNQSNLNSHATKVDPDEILGAAREMKEAVEVSGKVAAEAETTAVCLHSDSKVALDLTHLDKLVDMARTPHSYIRAANMWGVTVMEASAAQLDLIGALTACSLHAVEKKKAMNVVSESLRAYTRLASATAAFALLALQQTEWEEQTTKKQSAIQEQ
jgi:hypothetical protein